MAEIITPQRFATAFEEVVEMRKGEIVNRWNPWDAREYTKLFLNREGGVLWEVAKNLGLRYEAPWWTLDAIFFKDQDRVHFPKTVMPRHLSVAIEHENFSVRSAYQANKLSIFNASLKVLVIYPGRRGSRGMRKVKELLDRCAGVVREGDALHDFSSSRKQMVVLGSDDPHYTEGMPLSWRYFLYRRDRFGEIRS